jgi:uncharacterized membrane protein YagU involved in acid resistance
MNVPNTMFAVYFYCLFMTIGWLTLWFADICKWLDGTTCNDIETLAIRTASFLFLYLASLPFLMAYTNQNNPAFLKRLAFHMMYGLGVMVGSLITLTPSLVEPKWYHFGDMVTFLILFGLLHASTSNDLAPVGTQQSLWEGHGANPRTFLSIVAIAILVKVLTVPDFMPLSRVAEYVESVTARAETFFSFALCQTLALLFLLTVPIHYGSAKDQLNTTILIVVVEVAFGMAMFWGLFGSISSQWHTMTMWSGMVFGVLILIALVGAYLDAKRGKYDRIPDGGTTV